MAAAAKDGQLAGTDAFMLWDTYGFPVDLTEVGRGGEGGWGRGGGAVGGECGVGEGGVGVCRGEGPHARVWVHTVLWVLGEGAAPCVDCLDVFQASSSRLPPACGRGSGMPCACRLARLHGRAPWPQHDNPCLADFAARLLVFACAAAADGPGGGPARRPGRLPGSDGGGQGEEPRGRQAGKVTLPGGQPRLCGLPAWLRPATALQTAARGRLACCRSAGFPRRLLSGGRCLQGAAAELKFQAEETAYLQNRWGKQDEHAALGTSMPFIDWRGLCLRVSLLGASSSAMPPHPEPRMVPRPALQACFPVPHPHYLIFPRRWHPQACLPLPCSGVPLTDDEPKYAAADVETKVLAILG
jgi:hypothetical protein